MKRFALALILLMGFTGIGSALPAQSSNGNPPAFAASQPGLGMQTVTKVLKKAKSHFNVSLGTLVSGYCSGSCKVTRVGITSSGDGLYRVEYGGGSVIISIEIVT